MNEFFKTRARFLADTPLLCPGTLSALVMTLQEHAAEPPGNREFKEKILLPKPVIEDGIAIIPVEGVMMHNATAVEMYYFDAVDTGHIGRMIEDAANDSEVKGILLHIDSGGGMLTGTPEVADAINAARKKKPVFSFTDGLMASAAYWIGSQADAVFSTRSAQTGSIGVYVSLLDYTKWLEEIGLKVELIKNKEGDLKAIGAIGTSLSEAQRKHLQDRVDRSFKTFAKEVQARRGELDSDTMRGQTFYGPEAKRAGLVDAVGSLAYAKTRLRAKF